MLADFFKLSLNNLKKRPLRSFLTILGIFIGIAAVVSLISLGDGLRTAITGQFGTLSADKLTVQNAGTGFGPPGSTVVRKLTSHDFDIVKKVNGVEIAISRLIRVTKVEYSGSIGFFYTADIPETQKEIDVVNAAGNLKVAEGRLLKEGDAGKVVLGSDVANSNSFDKPITLGKKILIQGEQFEVVGILKKGSSFQTNLVVFMSHKDMVNALRIGDEIDLIVAQVSDPNQAETVAERLEKAIRKDRGEKVGEEDFSVQTPLQAISSVNSVLDIINVIVSGIAAISLLIGGIGIANTMYTSVLERKKEIGTMKAVGATNRQILGLFVFESGFLGLVGGILGAAIGLGLAFLASGAANAAFGQTILSVSISWPLLIGAVAFSFGIGLLSGFAPSLQASKLKPVDALRG
jgi:putative ABC transport system permease protein